MKKIALTLIVALVPFAAGAADLKGKWLTSGGKGQVLFEPCGAKLCGKIVWLREPDNKTGKPAVDARNEEPSLRSRPVLGLRMAELESDGDRFWKGTIYNPDDGKTYTAKAAMQSDGTLLVKGCILGGLVCNGETWTHIN